MMSFAVYIHWPFCLSICPYCDFNRTLLEEIDIEAFEEAYLKEMQLWRAMTGPRCLSSIFFGGGTPSLMPADLVERLIQKAFTLWSADPCVEVTLEMNPTSVDIEKMERFRQAGVNRASIGIQSLRPETLHFLGRKHTSAEAIKALYSAKNTFDNWSFDLIYAHPHHTSVEIWEEELSEALSYAGKHLSLYQLTYEPSTPFYTQWKRGGHGPAEEELSLCLYQATNAHMEKNGFEAYEVSNYAQEGYRCRHNLAYWTSCDFAGIGPGAHGRITLEGQRFSTSNAKAYKAWISNCKKKKSLEVLPIENPLEETLLMGLRLKEGIPYSFPLSHVLERKIETLQKEGFVVSCPQRLQLTESGRLCLDSIISYLCIE